MMMDGDAPRPVGLSYFVSRVLVGLLGLALPWLIILAYALSPTEGAGPQPLTSISIYAWTDANIVFKLIMGLIGAFLIGNCVVCYVDRCWTEAIYGLVSGASALIIVVARTGVDGERAKIFCPDKIACGNSTAHAIATAVFMVTMIGYAIWFFVREPGHRYFEAIRKFPIKIFYIFMGFIIALMFIWIAFASVSFLSNLLPPSLGWIATSGVFWPEAVAVSAFGFAWLVKGAMMREARGLSLSLILRRIGLIR
ncbi:MAG: hypothetical protein AAFR46_08095 [Pseudomonadota bacterium]